jgi:DNA polymerase (family X)
MTNKQISRTLKLASSLIEITGGNAFRARAYAGAARAVDGLDEAVTALIATDGLRELRGIGSGIAGDIEALVETGSFDTLDQLLAAVPPGLLDVLRVKGLGPKRARTLWTELGVTSLDALEEMALTGRIAALAGFGKKTEETLLAEVRRLREYLQQRHYFHAVEAVQPVLDALRASGAASRAAAAGDLRRRAEIVSALEVVAAGEPDALRAALESVASPAGDGDLRFTLPDGLPLAVHACDAASFPATLWRRSGSAAHVSAFEDRFGAPLAAESEEAIYEAAGLAFIPPELREGGDELDAAASDRIPQLIEVGDLRGTVHNHTTASDGAHTLREMAGAARAMGYQYLGVCDHSQSLVIANGLTVDRLRRQGDEIRALNEEIARDGGPPFRILHGTECDVMPDGSLDFPDDVLAELDLVVASIHTRFGMTEQEATERLIRAVQHPLVDILGHMTGRLLLRREGYPVDHDAVIEACAASGVSIELNANPYRLDMDWRFVRRAAEAGVMISINPDAHSTEELRYVEFGVSVARKGWLTASQCLNALPLDRFEAWLAGRRAAAAA